MLEREWTYTDRTNWRPGPWDSEPDACAWTDEATRFPCVMARGTGGAWCGYVGVPAGHPCHGIDWSELDVSVHGGVSWAASLLPEECIDVTLRREAQDYYWIGFDCAHAMDGFPCVPFWPELFDRRRTYRDAVYVRNEVTELAAQLYAYGLGLLTR